jgi:ABC-2 type transport system permease protein
VSTLSILAGKALACLAMSVLAMGLLTLIGVLAFHVRLVNPLGYALAVLCAASCFTGLMMLISTLGSTEQAVAGAGWAILMVLAMFGGAMMPLYFMPDWMQTVSSASPVRWAILALEGALWRGFSLNELAPYCVLLLSGGALAFVAGVFLARRQQCSA